MSEEKCDFCDDWEEDFEDNDWDDFVEDMNDLKIDKSVINLTTGHYNNKDLKVSIDNRCNLINMEIYLLNEIFRMFTNIDIEILKINIIFDNRFRIERLKVFSDKYSETDILILCKLNKRLKNLNLDLKKDFIIKIMDNITEYLCYDIYNKCYICDNVGVVDRNIFNNKGISLKNKSNLKK